MGPLTRDGRGWTAAWPVLLALALTVSGAGAASTVGPVANGGFELYADTQPEAAPTDSSAADEALFWDTDAIIGDTTSFEDADGDGDREAVIHACDPECGARNLLQSFATSSVAFSANLTAYTFALEEGTIPDEASVWLRISFRPACLAPQGPDRCRMTLGWNGGSMAPDGDGRVRLDPAQARLFCVGLEPDGGPSTASHDPACEALRQEWASSDEDWRRDLLDDARITHQFFFAFNEGAERVVLDGVRAEGAQPFTPEPGPYVP